VREDETFFQQVALREIFCPCGEHCIDLGVWEPKKKREGGNPCIAKHKTLSDLYGCLAARVWHLHLGWLKSEAARIKLVHIYGDKRVGKIETVIRRTPFRQVNPGMRVAVERLKFHRYSQPDELLEAAHRQFGELWVVVLERSKS
jgi:hypothetical protein